MSVIPIAFSYSADALVRAALSRFHVFAVNDAGERLSEAVVVLPENMPTPAAPLELTMPEGATQVEVVSIDLSGYENTATFLQVSLEPAPAPPVSPVMLMWGQSRYLDYEVSPGGDYGNVFPQGCSLLRVLDSQCSFYEINTAPGVYEWTKLDAHLDSCEMRGIEVLYCFCYTPEWAIREDWIPEWDEPGIRTPHSNYPPRLDVFEEFVRALLAHVRRPDGSSRIKYYEAWNETNALGYWNGSDEILLEQQKMLHRVLKELAPDCLLTLPTPTKNFTTADEEIDKFLQMGFQQFAHIVSFHGYCDKGTPGNAIVPTLEKINAVMAKHGLGYPIWDTEFNHTQGYPDDGQIPPSAVYQWIKDAMIARLENGIAAAIWHQWDNPNACGTMCHWTGEINEAGHAWIDLYNSVHPLPGVIDLCQVSAHVAKRD